MHEDNSELVETHVLNFQQVVKDGNEEEVLKYIALVKEQGFRFLGESMEREWEEHNQPKVE
jgi:hypothetical protein